MTKEFVYPGYMSKEAQDFLMGHYVEEERDGLGVVGIFIKTHDGKTIIPSKGDILIKDENGISLGEKKPTPQMTMSPEDKHYIRSTIYNEGSVEYAIINYSNYTDIDDPEFHRLRNAYINARNKLLEYLEFENK